VYLLHSLQYITYIDKKMKFKDALQHFDFELNTLVFARVIRSTCKEEHRQTSVTDATKDDAYSYYYGFATQLDLMGKSRDVRIWFKKTTKTSNSVYIGPVQLQSTNTIPPPRTIIMGIVNILPKGRAFQWWVDDAGAMLYFCRFLKYQSGVKANSSHLYNQLALKGTYHDELWALLKLLLFGDVLSFVKESGPEEERVRHPVLKSNYTYKRGYSIRETPARFVLAVSLMAQDTTIYDRYVTLMKVKGYTNSLDVSVPELESLLSR
tara:strand:+ start:4100 stop:4894 length:795 start_codon:yes stop_codon:yes gene_type:complete